MTGFLSTAKFPQVLHVMTFFLSFLGKQTCGGVGGLSFCYDTKWNLLCVKAPLMRSGCLPALTEHH